MSNVIKNMYITSLHARNVRKFEELKIEFNEGFNFLVGPNGSGKTSILRILSMCLSYSLLADSRLGENPEVWTDYAYNDKQYRLGYNTGWAETSAYRETKIKRNAPALSDHDRHSLVVNQIEEYTPLFCPLFIGAHRKFEYMALTGMSKENSDNKARAKYRDEAPESLNGTKLPNVKQWMINRYFIIDKEWAHFEKENWHWLIDNLEVIGPAGSGFTFKEIGRELEPKFILYGKETYLEELSAGFQSVLSIVLSIFEWIESIHGSEDKLVKKAKGTVVIDELDVHLHPEWQLTISDSLKKIFPHIQFITTTHSPHIIASADEGEIIIIPKENVVDIKPSKQSYSGWSTDQILEDIMGVVSLDNKQYAKLIDKAYGAYYINNLDELKKTLEEIKNIVHPNDTVIEVLQMKLAELMLKEGD